MQTIETSECVVSTALITELANPIINRMTKIAIVEDNATVRNTLARWIDQAPGLNCICVCASAEEAIEKLPRLEPDVVLMDIQLPNRSGIECTARLRQICPKAQVIMVTVYRDYDRIFQAMKAGACGYLLKRSSEDELIRAIAEVLSGGAPMSGEIARRVIESFRGSTEADAEDEMGNLSRREHEILDLLCQGFSNKEIADRLCVGVETIRTHLKRIYDKLHVRSRTEAAIRYRDTQA